LIDRLFTQLPSRSYTIRVDPAVSIGPIREILSRIFETQPIAVTEGDVDQQGEIEVVRDGTVVAASSAEEIMQSVLLVNSDVYITGSRTLAESELPDVLRALQEVPFQLRGYPESDSEKLLLIAVSRAIERRAYEAGAGTLQVGFQQLSRLVEEPGTYRVYEQLCATDLDIHAYGVEDVSPPADLDLTLHPGSSRLHRRDWFVAFQPESTDDQPAGLFSTEREPNRWDGFWTFDPARVTSIRRVIEDADTIRPTDSGNSRNSL
jgi:DICT domain-containing protein